MEAEEDKKRGEGVHQSIVVDTKGAGLLGGQEMVLENEADLGDDVRYVVIAGVEHELGHAGHGWVRGLDDKISGLLNLNLRGVKLESRGC